MESEDYDPQLRRHSTPPSPPTPSSMCVLPEEGLLLRAVLPLGSWRENRWWTGSAGGVGSHPCTASELHSSHSVPGWTGSKKDDFGR